MALEHTVSVEFCSEACDIIEGEGSVEETSMVVVSVEYECMFDEDTVVEVVVAGCDTPRSVAENGGKVMQLVVVMVGVEVGTDEKRKVEGVGEGSGSTDLGVRARSSSGLVQLSQSVCQS